MSDTPTEPPDPERLLGMTHDEFRAAGHALVDWVADFAGGLEELPVGPVVEPGEVRSRMAPLPDAAEPFDGVLADLDRIVVPGLTNWQSPRWFGYFPTGASYPSALGDLVSAILGQVGFLWSSSPITTELEQHVLDELVGLMGLPEAWRTDGPGGGVIQHSASDSTHTVLVVARDLAAKRHGVTPDRCVAYASTQAHSSIEKGAHVAGYGHVRLVDVDERFALRPEALRAAIEEDRAAGLHPTFVCAAVGTTGTTAVDPVREVAQIARGEGLWCHVDAAYAGAAMLLEECRWMQDGVELVDSYTWNPHKWLAVGFDCSVLHVADREPLVDAMSITPSYLRDAHSDAGGVVDYRDWHVPLGRRPRALKLWFVLRLYGLDGLRGMLGEHLRLARWLDDRVDAHPSIEIVAPTLLGLVSLRHRGGDEVTDRLADAVNADGRFRVTPASVSGPSTGGAPVRFVRVSIGASLTEQRHVEELWQRLDAAATALS